jgi:hypothetical protein
VAAVRYTVVQATISLNKDRPRQNPVDAGALRPIDHVLSHGSRGFPGGDRV